ncbi:helix-turn-helix transcriptional regulator [Sphingobacterium sp. KU25419]|nr:helix-turn-helix transcriptional regulator [Sphingobacterium sp. KU25419]
MSARGLNLICHQILQQSVSEIIETRKLIEAKNLLMNTDKTISEIGFELGYTDKAYFANVFKRKSSQTPSEFRAGMKALFPNNTTFFPKNNTSYLSYTRYLYLISNHYKLANRY